MEKNKMAIQDQSLGLLFRKLIQTLDRNNEVMSNVSQVLQTTKDSCLTTQVDDIIPMVQSRDEVVQVWVQCTFLNVLDIDTLLQLYEAEFFIKMKWEDDSFEGMSQEELDRFDERKLWRPKCTVINVIGELDMEKKTHTIQAYEKGFSRPVVTQMWRFKGKFRESLELQHFPVDVQDLTIQLSSERSENEIDLLEDQHALCAVNKKSFMDAQEWTLYSHVETFRDRTTIEHVSSTVHPILNVRCRVARKVGFFVWNIIFIVLLIIVLIFGTYSIDAKTPDRLAVTITLFLTSVAFKLVVKQSLPTISYLTYLDIYILAALVFLVINAAQNCLIALYGRTWTLEEIHSYDRWSVASLVIILLSFHILFGIHIYFTASKRRRIMKKKDRLYVEKKRYLERHGVVMPTRDLMVSSLTDFKAQLP